jgi:hypothetical protein
VFPDIVRPISVIDIPPSALPDLLVVLLEATAQLVSARGGLPRLSPGNLAYNKEDLMVKGKAILDILYGDDSGGNE